MLKQEMPVQLEEKSYFLVVAKLRMNESIINNTELNMALNTDE